MKYSGFPFLSFLFFPLLSLIVPCEVHASSSYQNAPLFDKQSSTSPSYSKQKSRPSQHSNSNTITFNGVTYYFARQDIQSGITFREYLPKGQTLENWKERFVIRFMPSITDPVEFMNLVRSMRSEIDPDKNKIGFARKKNGSSAAIAFSFSQDTPACVEYILQRASSTPSGIITYEISFRNYNTLEQSKGFLAKLHAQEEDNLRKILKARFPTLEESGIDQKTLNTGFPKGIYSNNLPMRLQGSSYQDSAIEALMRDLEALNLSGLSDFSGADELTKLQEQLKQLEYRSHK